MGSLLLLSSLAHAATPLEFDGERYERANVIAAGNFKLANYMRAGETPKKWTKSITITHHSGLSNPALQVAEYAKRLQQENPKSRSKILVKDDRSEAQIDYLTWPADASYMQFTVSKYLKVNGLSGLVSYRFTYKFDGMSKDDAAYFKSKRQRWVGDMFNASFPVELETNKRGKVQ